MQRKLLATLVASALEIVAASSHAAAICEAPNTSSVNGASAVRAAGLNPVDGFPEYVTDANNLSLKRCVDAAVCFFDPVLPGDPFSLQIGTGGEAFYWSADAVVNDVAGTPLLKITMAAETAFLSTGPNGEPINGTQLPFLRLRIVIDAPVAGRYTVKHPYGTEVFDVAAANLGPRAVFATIDTGLTAGQSTSGRVGPFLTWPAYQTSAPAGFVGDVNVPSLVVGSPCGADWNRVSLSIKTGPALTVDHDFGNGQTELVTDLFTVQGAVQDTARVQTFMQSDRLSYTRSAQGAGQIDAYATSTPSATVTVVDGPTTPADASRIPEPVTLSAGVFADSTRSLQSSSVQVADASALPAVVTLTASSPSTIDTRLNVGLVDFVDISQADWDQATGLLTVVARSGDSFLAPTLTLRRYGDFAPDSATLAISTAAPPAVVHVDSSAGGTAQARVRVLGTIVPGTLTASALGTTRLTLNWTDNSAAETAFNVYRVAANGTRTLIGSTAANVTSFTVGTGTAPNTALSASTAYTFQVDAVIGGVGQRSNPLVITTPALPAAPGNVSAAMVNLPAQKAVTITWADNAQDETGYIVSRATGASTTYTVLPAISALPGGMLPPGTTSFSDTTAVANTVYTYRVTTARDLDRSLATAAGATSLALRTSAALAATQTPLAPTGTVVNTRQIDLRWADRVPAPTATLTYGAHTFQVYRRVAAVTAANGAPAVVAGNFEPVSGVLPSSTLSFSDTTVVPGVSYNYRIDTSNWAGTFSPLAANQISAVLVTRATLAGVTALAATPVTAAQPSLGWIDNTTDESAYRVRRRALVLNATTGAVTGTLAQLTNLAANASSFNDGSTLAAKTLYEYEIAPMSGTTVGPLATVVAAPGGIASVPTLTNVTAAATTVTVTWPAVAATELNVGGYTVQRCTVSTVAPVETCTGGTGWAAVGTVAGRRTGTVSFAHTGQAVSTPAKTCFYRVVTTTGLAVTGVTGTPSATRSITR